MPSAYLAPKGTPVTLLEFEHAGATLIAETFGEGPHTYLLLHGIGMGRSVYLDIVQRLAACIEEGFADGSIAAGPQPQQCALALYEMWLGAALLTKLRRDPSALDGAMHATRALLHLPGTFPA